MKILLLLSYLIPTLAYTYSINRGDYGEELHWQTSSQSVYFNTSNSSAISSGTLSTVLVNSTNEITAQGFTLSPYTTTAGEIFNRNDIYFSNDSSIFGGTSVLAITKVSYDGEKIVEADVIINDAVSFSGTAGSANYIGDVLTHELGHFVGLGHSQVHGSTMFYSLNNGQDSLHDDDIAGIKHLYNSGGAEISGTVVGGNSVGVFGAHVQAISSEDGEVKAAAISESDGSFIISGLSTTDTYFLYVEPLDAVSNLPTHYETVRNNFCLSSGSYRGTFLQSCRRSEEGRPQGVSVTGSGVVNVGNVSIGCDLSVPVSYMQNKPSTTNSIDAVDYYGNAGDVVVGYFSEDEASSNTADEYEIDLQNYTVPSGDIYLDIKIVSQSLYSPIRTTLSSISETIEFESSPDMYGLYYDEDGNPDLDVTGRIKLDSTPSNNVFKFKVTPEKLSDFIGSKPFSVDSFLPSSSNYQDDMNFYMMILTVSKKESGVYTKISEKSFSYQDNSSCIDAPLAYAVSESSQQKSSALEELEKRKNQKDPEILSCGTVGGPGGPSSGVGGFIFAFALGVLMAGLTKSINLHQS